MGGLYVAVAASLWLAWVVSWYAAAFWRHQPVLEEPGRRYRPQVALAVAGFMLAFGVAPWFRDPLWSTGPVLGWSMLAVCTAGLAFTWWARLHMGPLWHGGVSRTEQHRIVDTGPFAIVRHPIYTGMISSVVAVALLQGRILALIGAVLFALGFILKARVEERFLEAELPGYAEYRKRVRMIVPFVI